MDDLSLYGAFNARWITPSQVASSFVPTPQYTKLAQVRHSLLMGPRGCGKTTLLKMLTNEAQCAWAELVQAEKRAPLRPPAFVAVYVPSDIRWAYELDTARAPQCTESCSRVSQHLLTNCTIATACLRTFAYLLGSGSAATQRLAITLIDQLGIRELVPTFSHLGLWFHSAASGVRTSIAAQDTLRLQAHLDKMPSDLVAHPFDFAVWMCSVFDEFAPAGARPEQWALCFDELEIAPRWLQHDLLQTLRSSAQRFLLKLTWVPTLPVFPESGPQPQADYDIIRLWFSHIQDARLFCDEFSQRLIRKRTGDSEATATALFGRSVFASEERAGECASTYEPDGDAFKAMVELAKRDPAFARYLERKGFDPSHPVSDSVKERDECQRKVKPIVFLRETFLGSERARSRKRIALYSGIDAIFAMSDGNPRWLSGLLNNLLDQLEVNPTHEVGDGGTGALQPVCRPPLQAQVLRSASARFVEYGKAFPISPVVEGNTPPRRIHLADLVEHLGAFFQEELLGRSFSDDPVGSFVLDEGAPADVRAEVERGLLLGVFVPIATTQFDVPVMPEGGRYRLSFMLSPHFRLAFRNFRAKNLSTILRGVPDPNQLDLFGPVPEGTR